MTKLARLSPRSHATGPLPDRPRARPRWISRRSPALLSDVELVDAMLEVIGGEEASAVTGRELLAASRGVGGLGAWVNLHLSQGQERGGLTRKQLQRMALSLELGQRASRAPLEGRRVKSHHDVQRWAGGRLVGLEHEEVWVLPLRANHRVLAEWCVARGGLHGCGMLPADVLRPVLRCAASAFILVHNHPSGDPTPSRDDIAMTHALYQGALVVGLTLVDHVIVSRGGSYSLAEACSLDSLTRGLAAE